MLNFNRAQIIGNLTRDPELRYTASGQPVASFGVATNRSRRTPEGDWENLEPEFHNVVVWAKLAESCQKYLHKGDRIFAAGRLQTHSWEGQDGVKRQRTEIIADTIVGPDQTKKALVGGARAEEVTEEITETEPVKEIKEEDGEKTKKKIAQPKPTKKKTTKPSEEKPEEEINLDDIPF